MPRTDFIDLSHWNWIPENLMAAEDAGVGGMLHKITEGTSVIDDKFQARFYLAREAGMLVGGYHFIRPGDPKQQAEFFLSRLVGYMDDQTLLACDYEDSRVSLADVRAWMDAVEKKSGRSCVLYSGHVLKEAVAGGQDPGWLPERRLWLAQYGPKPELPKGWEDWWGWQWSDRGSVPGVDPPTDVNELADPGSMAVTWSGSLGTPPPPEEGELVVEVRVPAGVKVIVTEV